MNSGRRYSAAERLVIVRLVMPRCRRSLTRAPRPVDGKPTFNSKKCPNCLQRDQAWAFVIRHAAELGRASEPLLCCPWGLRGPKGGGVKYPWSHRESPARFHMGRKKAASPFRAERNERSLARLRRALPGVFPACVMTHALARPWIPPTPRLAVDSYWRAHPIRADRLARALAARSGAPEGWRWRVGDKAIEQPTVSVRAPPAPYRLPAFSRGPGHCRVCDQPVYRFGWHVDLWGDRKPNKNASWHTCCVVAWKLWTAPSAHARALRKLQSRRCVETGKRLLRTGEVDHRVPLYRVWREHRELPWPRLLAFWGVPNLQVINREAHVRKCMREAQDRAAVNRSRVNYHPADPVSWVEADCVFRCADPRID